MRYKLNTKRNPLEPSFSPRDVTFKRNVDAKQLYELISEIGRGKFGTVYKCREKSTDLELAAKFVPIPKREDRRNVEREVEIMNSLQHPLIIQLYAAYEYQKMMCVVLELIEGGELFDRVVDDDFVLTERVCTIFMRQVCEGMQFIHRNNILHLDLKPENILCLTKEGNRIKIIDFGLARKYDPDKKLQVLFGTPEFVAPEVVNFDSISFGTDMWSVGVICYVLLSGLSPFMGETDIETMANVTIAKYDFDDEAFNNVSPEALDFISKLLMKDMNSRMTASECLEHKWLERYRKSAPSIQSQNILKSVTMPPPQLQQQEQISNSPPKYIMTPPTPPIITPEQPPPSYSVAVPTMAATTTPLDTTKTQIQTKDIIQLPSPPSIPSEKSLQQPQPPTPEIQSTLTEELPQPKKSTIPSVIPLTTTNKTTTPPQQPSPTSQSSSPSPSPSPTKNKTELLEQAKDNLKTFIERWEEHPNSPYIFDSGSYLIAPIHLDSSNSATKGSSNVSSRDTISASTSLKKFWKNYSCENQRINEACSPSPCESLCSVFDDVENTQSNPASLLENKSILDDVDINTTTTTNTTSRKKINSTITPITITATDKNNKDDTNNNINVDDIKSIKSKNIKEYLHSFDRRNSDTNYLLRRRPSSEKVNLAEEIRKLSDHLLMLAAINTKLVKDNEEIHKENQLQQQESQQQQQPQQPKSRTNSTSDKLETIQESIAISTKTNSNQIKEPKLNSSTVKTTIKKSTSVIESPNTSKSTTVSKTSETTTSSSTTSKSSSKKVSTLSVLLQQSLDETPKLSSNDNDKNKNQKKFTSSSSSSSSTTTITTTPKSNNLSVPPTTTTSSSSSSSSTSLSSTDRASKLINGFKQQLLSTSTSTMNMISGGSGVPWPITNKRTKFRINQMSRDVPIGSPDTHQPIDLEDAANTTKDCLLHLLEKYNDTNETRKYKNCSIGRHQSISVDWNISDNLENQSMSSINAFFRRHSPKGNYVRQLQAQLEAKSNQK